MRSADSGRLLRFLEGKCDGDARLFCDGLTVATGLAIGCAERGGARTGLDLERSERSEPSRSLDGPAIADGSLSGDAKRISVGSDASAGSEPDPDGVVVTIACSRGAISGAGAGAAAGGSQLCQPADVDALLHDVV